MEISIIIATYNAGKVLRRCLDSIIDQLSTEVELIVIDGGSNDKTLDIIESYKDSISFKVSEPDSGIYDAWNKGIAKAKGNWIMFIGADDILLPDAIQNYLNAINTTSAIGSYDYICAENEYIDNNGKLLKIMGAAPTPSKMQKKMMAAHVASLHSKSNLFDQVGVYDFEQFRICSDYELLLRKGKSLKYIFLPIHIARMQAGGMSFSIKAIVETFEIRKLHRSISPVFNYILLVKDYASFKFFIFRKKLMGHSI
ncbi:glycosyltransferase family 2 protein [Sphingobacterium siyangense]|uniref:glycosyltransferase family 2 protein n=1 Tax=Sphingobacterium siyangense TaxID=459529 RepID=UPI00301A8A82